MTKKTKVIIIFCAAFFSMNAFAEIYKSVDADGVVTYSDQPTSTSQAVELPSVNVSTQPAQSTDTAATDSTDAINTDSTNATDKTSKSPVEKRVPYTAFVVTSPADQETFQNAESISVSVSFSPALQLNDKIEYLLDGKLVSDAITSNTYSIPKTAGNKTVIDRGSHTIQARIVDSNGDVMATTPPITIFSHYATVTQQQVR